MAGGDSGLQRIRAARAVDRGRLAQRGKPAADEKLVPAAAVLVEQ